MVSIRRDESNWRTYIKVARAGLVYGAMLIILGASNPPSPSGGQQHSPPQEQASSAQTKSEQYVGYAANRPLFVQIEPTPKTNEEASRDAAKETQNSFDERWALIFTGISTVIFFAQLVVFGVQARVFWVQAGRLKDTIDKMDEVAKGQTADMGKSIKEAARAADAMKEVANSIAASTVITSQMSRDQQKFWKMQMRAYVAVNYLGIAKQDNSTNWRTQVRLSLTNTGHTPAYGLKYRALAAILPYPLPDDFDFSIPESPETSKSDIGPGQNRTMSANVPVMATNDEITAYTSGNKTKVYMWGKADYIDAFEEPRFVKFCFFVNWLTDGSTLGTNTRQHNESD